MRKIAGAAGFRVGLGLAVASAIAASALVFVPETANAVGAPETIPGTSKEEAASSSLLGIEGEGSQEASHGAELSEQPGQDASAEGELNLPSVDDEASAQATSPSGVGAGADEGPSAVDSIEPRQFGHSQGAVSGGEAELSEPGVQVNSDSLQARLAGTCSLNEREKSNDWLQNDALSSANSIPLGSTICGYIGHERDTDFFRFDTSAGSHRVTFKFDAPKVGGNLYKVRIYDDSQNYVKSWNVTAAAANGTWLSKQLTRLPSGTGYVEVLPLSNKVVGKKYSLSVAKVNAAAVDSTSASEGCLAEREVPNDWLVNDSLSSANFVAIGSTICGYIGHERDSDIFKFDVSAGSHRLTLRFDDPKVGGDVYKVRVYDDSQKVVKSWNLTAAAANGTWLSKQLTRLPSGTGYVEVLPLSNKVVGKKYSLSVAKVNAAAVDSTSASEGCLAEREEPKDWLVNDSMSSADALALGTTICGYIGHERDTDFYAFSNDGGAHGVKFSFDNAYDPPTKYYFTAAALDGRGKTLRTWKLNAGDWKGKTVEVSFPKGAAFISVSNTGSAFWGEAYKLSIVPVKKGAFIDVSSKHTFFKEIEWMHSTGLSTGTKTSKGLAYQPSSAVSRQAMAAFLYRQSAPKNYKAPRVSPFADVPTSHKFYKEIAWMSESKISTGFKVGNKRHFKPNANVSRSAMAAFLYRIHGPAKGSVPSSAPFADVPRGHQLGLMHV